MIRCVIGLLQVSICLGKEGVEMPTGEEGRIPFHDFFAGSGLVSYGLRQLFSAVWANDISERKQRVYQANLGSGVFVLGDVATIHGSALPHADLSWASFPCQDLSLAGLMGGIHASRSGLVWQWLRIIDEMGTNAPSVVCLENVTGLISVNHGENYRTLHKELVRRGYRAGVIMVDACRFLPQSRQRVFVIATRGLIPESLIGNRPTWLQTPAIRRVGETIDDFVWWSSPEPAPMTQTIADIVQTEVPYDKSDVVRLIPQKHLERFLASGREYVTGYRRIRSGKQVLELRRDAIAGCLRTPVGGSSKQFLIHRMANGGIEARFLTVREVARLMGAPESWKLPGTANDGFMAMGDAVAVPVAQWVAATFLAPLVRKNGNEGQ